MLFINKLLARCSEKRIATCVHDVNYTTYSNIAVMYHRGRDVEIFLTAPEVDFLSTISKNLLYTNLSLGT